MIVHAQNYAVVLATEEVLSSWILEVVEGSDLNDVVRRVINILAFCSTQFLYLYIISKIKLVLILYSK